MSVHCLLEYLAPFRPLARCDEPFAGDMNCLKVVQRHPKGNQLGSPDCSSALDLTRELEQAGRLLESRGPSAGCATSADRWRVRVENEHARTGHRRGG